MATPCPNVAAIATTSNGRCDPRKHDDQFSRYRKAKTRASRPQLRVTLRLLKTLQWKAHRRSPPKQLQIPDSKHTAFSRVTSQAMLTVLRMQDSTSPSPHRFPIRSS